MNELNSISKDFPILDQFVNDEPLVYLDNAATTQKPQQVLDVLADYYQQDNANVHRGCIPFQSGQQLGMKLLVKRLQILFMQNQARKFSLLAEQQRV